MAEPSTTLLPTAPDALAWSPAQDPRGPDSTVALLLCIYGPPVNPPHLQPLQYWPFSSADLYNWKTNHPSFSENPTTLTELVESLMISPPTHLG